MTPDTATLKREAKELLDGLADGAPAHDAYHEDAVLHLSHPWGRRTGDGIGRFHADLMAALPRHERRDLILIAGANRDDDRLPGPRAPHWVAALGQLHGTMEGDLARIPATGRPVMLQYGECVCVEGGRIRERRTILDLVDLARQAETFPLPRPYGVEGAWPSPATQDGWRPDGYGWAGPDALRTVFAMHDALHAFDGADIGSMDHGAHWAPEFMYFAGGGIGAARGLDGFRTNHQIPFLHAFPDRASEGHHIRIAEGPYAVTGGTVRATHQGEYLGLTPTGRRVGIPVMDFYRIRADGRIAENWLPIDVAGMAHQMGADLLARAAHYGGRPRTQL